MRTRVAAVKEDGSGKPIRPESGDGSDQTAPLYSRAVSIVLGMSAVGRWVSLSSHCDCLS